MFNSVTLVGNLTRDPETRETPKKTTICTFGLAVNKKWKDRDGQEHQDTMFIDVEQWGNAAIATANYMSKGNQVLVHGELRLDQWEDKKTKAKRSRHKIVAFTVRFLGGKGQAKQEEFEGGDW